MADITSSPQFNKRWDNGAGWFDTAVASDGHLDTVEIAKGGGPARLADDYRSLSPADQRRALLALRGPEARTLLEQGLSPSLTPANASFAAEGRRYAALVLGMSLGDVAGGVTAANLGALPVREVPASANEALVEQLRSALQGGRWSALELGRFLADHPLTTPTVEASALARAIAADPQRFNGAQLRVVGEAQEISRHHSTGLTWGPKYDLLDGEFKFDWQTTSILETQHRMFTPGSHDAILVFDRAEESSFFTVGWIGLGSASARLPDGRSTVEGRIELSQQGPRLVLRDVKTR